MIEAEGKFFELIRVPDGDRAAWLDVRRKGIGGSDVAAIMGLSKYRTPYEVWAEKTGLADPADISDRPAVKWGNILEPVVGGEYAENHPDRKVRRVNAVLRSLSAPFAQASLDYEVRDPELGWGVLEIKTAGLRVADDWAEGVPVYYQTQIAHYMRVTGRQFADVAVLIGGSDYREYRIMRDEEDIRAVTGAVDHFWQKNVEKRQAPPVMGGMGEASAIFSAGNPSDGEIETAEGVPVEVADYIVAMEEEKRAKEELDRAKNALKVRIGHAKGLVCDEGRVSWVRMSKTRFDSKRFRADNPEAYKEYTTATVVDGGLRWTPRKR